MVVVVVVVMMMIMVIKTHVSEGLCVRHRTERFTCITSFISYITLLCALIRNNIPFIFLDSQHLGPDCKNCCLSQLNSNLRRHFRSQRLSNVSFVLPLWNRLRLGEELTLPLIRCITSQPPSPSPTPINHEVLSALPKCFLNLSAFLRLYHQCSGPGVCHLILDSDGILITLVFLFLLCRPLLPVLH